MPIEVHASQNSSHIFILCDFPTCFCGSYYYYYPYFVAGKVNFQHIKSLSKNSLLLSEKYEEQMDIF